MKFGRDIEGHARGVVTPFTGVWIEIGMSCWPHADISVVTPFTGVWIEIAPLEGLKWVLKCHTLHGCVD